jgi:hypothetical protein
MTTCTDATVNIVDKDDGQGDELSRWECSACRNSGNWTPTRERALIAIRGHAHTLRSRKKRPTKAQQAARSGRVAGRGEYAELHKAINLGSF